MSWGMFPVSRHARLFIGCLAFPGVITVELYLTAHVPGSIFGVGLTIFPACIAIVILYLLIDPPKLALRILQNRGLVFLGKISYGLYLWHIFAILLAIRMGFTSRLLTSLFSIVFAFLISCLSFYIIERPFLRLKKRFRSDHLISEHSIARNSPVVDNIGSFRAQHDGYPGGTEKSVSY